MDKDGVPLDMSTFGHVYIKYNSLPTERDGAGTANLAGYGGDFRGVYLNVDLQDGQFRQYAVLPLNLFGSEEAIPSPAVPPPSPPPLASEPAGAPLSTEAVRETLTPLLTALSELGVSTEVESVDAVAGEVVLRYGGPPKPKRALEMLLRSDFPSVQSVVFLDENGEATSAPPPPTATPAAAVEVSTTAVPKRFASVEGRFTSRSLDDDDARSSAFKTLHTAGWVVLRGEEHGYHHLDQSTLDGVKQTQFEPIFNGHKIGDEPLIYGYGGMWRLTRGDIHQCAERSGAARMQ